MPSSEEPDKERSFKEKTIKRKSWNWSSSQCEGCYASVQNFFDGFEGYDFKFTGHSVRAVHAF